MASSPNKSENPQKSKRKFRTFEAKSDKYNKKRFGINMELFPWDHVKYTPIVLRHLSYKDLMNSFRFSTMKVDEIFEEYRNLRVRYKEQSQYFSKLCATSKENAPKNRYIDIVAYDFNRVRCPDMPNLYLNGSYIKNFNNEVCIMVFQGPKENTIEDFVHFLFVTKTKSIVVLGKSSELVKGPDHTMLSKEKFTVYWPERKKTRVIGKYLIENIEEDNTDPLITIRTLIITDQSPLTSNQDIKTRRRTMTMYHITGFPDKEHPDEKIQTIIVYTVIKLLWNRSKDIKAVHCSAGVGRSAVFCFIYILLEALRNMIIPASLMASQVLDHLRNQRPTMIQTEKQYLYVNDFLETYKLMTKTLLEESTKPEKDRNMSMVNDFGMPKFKQFVEHFLTIYLKNEMHRPRLPKKDKNHSIVE